MGDLVKIAAKTVLIAVIMLAAAALLSGIVIPVVDTTPLQNALGKGLAIVNYYTQPYSWLVTTWVVLLGIKYIAYPIFMIASIGWRWIMKVNE